MITPWVYSWRYRGALSYTKRRLKQIAIIEERLLYFEEVAKKHSSEFIRAQIRELTSKIAQLKSDLID